MSDGSSPPRFLLPLVFAATLTSIMGNSLLAPAIPDILDTFDRPDSASGLLVAAASLPGIAMAPIIGLLADRHGRRAVLTPCLAVFGLAGILVATAPTFGALLLARFVLGVGAAGLVNLAIVLISDHYDGAARTRWIGVNSGVLTIALATYPLVAGVITDVVGWRWALAPQVLGLVGAVAAWRILEPAPPTMSTSFRDQLRGVDVIWRDTSIATSVIAAGVSFAVIFGVFLAALPTHLDNEFGLSAGWRGVVFGAPAITSSLVAFNLGRLRRYASAGALLAGAAVTWVLAFSMIGLAGALVLILVAALFYGFGEGAMIPTLQDVAMRRAPDSQRAAVMAAWTAFARLGQTVGPLVAALLLAGPGTTWALLAGAFGSAALVALFVLGPLRH